MYFLTILGINPKKPANTGVFTTALSTPENNRAGAIPRNRVHGLSIAKMVNKGKMIRLTKGLLTGGMQNYETPEQALKELETAVELWLSVAESDHAEIPFPSPITAFG